MACCSSKLLLSNHIHGSLSILSFPFITIIFSVESMMFVQGGIGPAGLSAEDLHVLDLTQQRPRWHRLEL